MQRQLQNALLIDNAKPEILRVVEKVSFANGTKSFLRIIAFYRNADQSREAWEHSIYFFSSKSPKSGRKSAFIGLAFRRKL